MTELESLIRVKKHEIEQKQKALSALYKQADDLKNERDALETQLAIEAEKTKEASEEMLGFFQPYAESVKRLVDEIDVIREKLEHQIKLAQDELRDAFADMKKVEIIDERRKAELLAEIEKKEAETLDEIAINMYGKKDEKSNI